MGFDRGRKGDRGGRGRDKREGFGDENFAGFDAEGHVADRRDRTVSLREALNLNHGETL